VAHVVFLTIGYAQVAKTGFWREFGVLATTFPDMLPATVGFSDGGRRGGLDPRDSTAHPRERWWALHLLMYLALGISFASHRARSVLRRNPLTRLLWSLSGRHGWLVLAYRIGLPFVRSMRHRLEVVEVREEAPGVVTVVCRGRRLERLAVSGGQFFEWRFLTRGMWWQAHPFSLSCAASPPIFGSP